MFKIIVISILLSSCQAAVYRETTVHEVYDDQLAPYIEEFLELTDRYGTQVHRRSLNTVLFGNPKEDTGSPGTVGVCIWYEQIQNNRVVSFRSNIVIDKDYFDSVGEIRKKWLMFHELGHCMLNLDHDDVHCSIMKDHMPGNDKIAEQCYDEGERLLFATE